MTAIDRQRVIEDAAWAIHDEACTYHDRSEEPFVDILMNSAVDAGVDPRHAIKILNPCQWWTVTKGENL